MNLRDLENYGFNVDEALELCINDEEILTEVLETALEEGREKIPLLKELVKEKDYDRYIVEVHGLKNAAKQIGADDLSETAKKSELLGKAGSIDEMLDNHDEVVSKYEGMVSALEALFAG